MKIKDFFLTWMGLRSRKTHGSYNANEAENEYYRDYTPNRSYQTLRDVKKKKKLRKLRAEGRRQSAPPEVTQYNIKNFQYERRFEVEKENFEGVAKKFEERPVDCDGLHELDHSLREKGLGRLRAASQTPEVKPKKRRPLSLGGVQSLLSTKKTQQSWTRPPLGNLFTTPPQPRSLPQPIEFAYGSSEKKNWRKNRPESLVEAEKFLNNLTYDKISTPISPQATREYYENRSPMPHRETSQQTDESHFRLHGSRDDFRKFFAQGLWSVEQHGHIEEDIKKLDIHEPPKDRSETLQEAPIYSKVIKKYKSCDLLSDTLEEKAESDRDTFNQYFGENENPTAVHYQLDSGPATTVSDAASSGVSSLSDHEKQTCSESSGVHNQVIREAFNATRHYMRERAASQPENRCLQVQVGGSSNTWSTTELAPCRVQDSDHHTDDLADNNEKSREQYDVVVAIDFGVGYSGFAFAFKDGMNKVQMMRRFDNADIGINSEKIPSCILLSPDGKFHSFGYDAREFYHDLEPGQAKQYMFFHGFKMAFHVNKEISAHDALIAAVNGRFWPAFDVFSQSLRYFKRLALMELSDQIGKNMDTRKIKWVITVPTSWSQDVRRIIREAAYSASLASQYKPEQLCIALEPEADGIFATHLKLMDGSHLAGTMPYFVSLPSSYLDNTEAEGEKIRTSSLKQGECFIVADCGAGTAEVSAHRVNSDGFSLTELTKTAEAHVGSQTVDREFEGVLCDIFTPKFISEFKTSFPAAWVDLMLAFESRKRSTHPFKLNPANVALPFTFMDFHKKKMGCRVDVAIKRGKVRDVSWNSQGMLRLGPGFIHRLFHGALMGITELINQVVAELADAQPPPTYLFLVGGFSENHLLQHEIKKHFNTKLKIIIPQNPTIATLKGAALYGLNPNQIKVRRSKMTYGIGVLEPFDPILHPPSKRIIKNGYEWCTDVFHVYVRAGEPITADNIKKRRYCPASASQKEIIIQIYSTEVPYPQFVTDRGVKKCAMIRLRLPQRSDQVSLVEREVETCMQFGETEITVWAVEKISGTRIKCEIEFLSQ